MLVIISRLFIILNILIYLIIFLPILIGYLTFQFGIRILITFLFFIINVYLFSNYHENNFILQNITIIDFLSQFNPFYRYYIVRKMKKFKYKTGKLFSLKIRKNNSNFISYKLNRNYNINQIEEIYNIKLIEKENYFKINAILKLIVENFSVTVGNSCLFFVNDIIDLNIHPTYIDRENWIKSKCKNDFHKILPIELIKKIEEYIF